MVRRLALCVLASCLTTCRSAEFTDDVRVAVQPRVLEDDGDRARVVVTASDRYGDPGTGSVHVVSSAGSLRDGLDLVLGADGSATTVLFCDVKQDADCHDVVTVTATWAAPKSDPVVKVFPVEVRTTDAFVSACAFSNRRMLKLLTGTPPIIQLAVLDTQPEVAKTPLGASVWDAASGVGALALTLPTRGVSITDEEAGLRALLGTGTNPLVQTFTTWDGFPAVRSTFDLESSAELKAQLQSSSMALGGTPSGLSGATTKQGPFKAELLVVRHDLAQTAVVLALTPKLGFTEGTGFDLEDVAGGSALSFAVDAPVQHCEIFTVKPGKKVDFLWVVDDSCSMATSQTAVATVGAAASARISGAQLDFHVAGVSTGWYPPGFFGSYRPWTQNLGTMLSWFRDGPLGWGTGGDGNEQGFSAIAAFLASDAGTELRPDSEVHIIVLSDTHDQSPLSAEQMKAALDQRFPKQHVVVSGIVCPEGHDCGDDRESAIGKYHTLIRATGGVLGSIEVFNPTLVTTQLQQQQADTMSRIVGTVVNGAGYELQYRPISPSLRIAASAVQDPRCDNRDIPRSRDNGWDMDPLTGRIAFYGWCVPVLGGTMVVSYESWARFGTQVHDLKTPVYAVQAPVLDGGSDAGTSDAGEPDAGELDAGP